MIQKFRDKYRDKYHDKYHDKYQANGRKASLVRASPVCRPWHRREHPNERTIALTYAVISLHERIVPHTPSPVFGDTRPVNGGRGSPFPHPLH